MSNTIYMLHKSLTNNFSQTNSTSPRRTTIVVYSLGVLKLNKNQTNRLELLVRILQNFSKPANPVEPEKSSVNPNIWD